MNKNVFLCALVGGLLFAITGCDFYEESYVAPQKMRVEHSQFNHRVDVDTFDADHAASVASLYDNAGAGNVRTTVIYDKNSTSNTATHANQHLARVISLLRKEGLTNVMGNIMPVHDSGSNAELLVTFDAYQVKAPLGCTSMPGMETNDVEHDRDYSLGCTRESVIAKQIARPKDLLGQTSPSLADGRRSANVLEGYRAGIPNAALEGESVSGGE